MASPPGILDRGKTWNLLFGGTILGTSQVFCCNRKMKNESSVWLPGVRSNLFKRKVFTLPPFRGKRSKLQLWHIYKKTKNYSSGTLACLPHKPQMVLSFWASSASDLCGDLEHFTAECEAAGTRVSNFEHEAMVPSHFEVDGRVQVRGEKL